MNKLGNKRDFDCDLSKRQTCLEDGVYMQKNEVVQVRIEDIGNDGEGIGRYEGYTLFVKDAVVGDVIRARLMKAKKNYGYAKIEEMLVPSPDRVTPKCPVAGKCGGCQLQQLSYEKQLEYKTNKVKNCLQRIGGLSEEMLSSCMEPILGMEEPYYYRNKAQFPVGVDKEGKLVTGFYAGHSHTIIDRMDCAIQEPVNEAILQVIKEFLVKYQVMPYNEETGTGVVRHILTRVGYATGEVMVCLVLNVKKAGQADSFQNASWWTKGEEVQQVLVPGLKKAIEEYQGKQDGNGEALQKGEDLKKTSASSKDRKKYVLKSLCININNETTNVILGKKVLPVYGETYIVDSIGDIQYQISPLSFYQVNPQQTEKLYRKVLDYADLHGDEIVWDLYCGIGTISLFLAQQAKMVYGVEIVPQAIDDAKRNAELNGIKNAEFFVGAAEEVMPARYRESGDSMRADVIVVDPPRKGCEQSLLETVILMQPKRVVYVSCDPATLARDVKYLGENGYEVQKVCPVDQFGHTGHVETVCLMSKVSE